MEGSRYRTNLWDLSIFLRTKRCSKTTRSLERSPLMAFVALQNEFRIAHCFTEPEVSSPAPTAPPTFLTSCFATLSLVHVTAATLVSFLVLELSGCALSLGLRPRCPAIAPHLRGGLSHVDAWPFSHRAQLLRCLLREASWPLSSGGTSCPCHIVLLGSLRCAYHRLTLFLFVCSFLYMSSVSRSSSFCFKRKTDHRKAGTVSVRAATASPALTSPAGSPCDPWDVNTL